VVEHPAEATVEELVEGLGEAARPSRRFFVAVAVALAALLMGGVSTAVKSAHSATPQTEAAAANQAFSGFHDRGIAKPKSTREAPTRDQRQQSSWQLSPTA
jgi:hypothetical protein